MPTWTKVTQLDALAQQGRVSVEIGGRDVAVLHLGDRIVALWNRCPHANGRLGDGEIKHGDIVCPLHRWRFSLTTGKTMRDRILAATLYPVRVEGNDVLVELP